MFRPADVVAALMVLVPVIWGPTALWFFYQAYTTPSMRGFALGLGAIFAVGTAGTFWLARLMKSTG